MPPIRAVTAPGETLVEVLVDGFYEDPFMSWIFVDPETRGEALAKWFRFWIELYGSDGRMFLTEDDSAASLWAMPEARGVDADVMPDFIALIAPWNGERTTLVLEGLGGLAQHPDETHWYLNAIAARRGRQGAGLGAQLLEPARRGAELFAQRDIGQIAGDRPVARASQLDRGLLVVVRTNRDHQALRER